MREDQIKRMVSEGKISREEGERLMRALRRSRSGDAEREKARRAAVKRRNRGRTLAVVVVLVLAAAAMGLTLGLYFGLKGDGSASELFEKGEQAFKEGRYEEAVELYREGLEKEPESSAGYNLLGMAYRFWYNETGNTQYRQKEIEAFEKAIELDPNNPVPLVNLGATLYYQGDKSEAAVYFNKALEVYPDHPEREQIENMIREGESGG